jgi:hypothetical protein
LNLSINAINKTIFQIAQMAIYKLQCSQHDLPFIKKKQLKFTGNAITFITFICVNFHNNKIFSLSGTKFAGNKLKSSKKSFTVMLIVYTRIQAKECVMHSWTFSELASVIVRFKHIVRGIQMWQMTFRHISGIYWTVYIMSL